MADVDEQLKLCSCCRYIILLMDEMCIKSDLVYDNTSNRTVLKYL